MPQNRLKHFPTALLRRGMVHFHPALPLPGYLPPARDEGRGNVWSHAGGPRPVDRDAPGPAAPPASPAADREPATAAIP